MGTPRKTKVTPVDGRSLLREAVATLGNYSVVIAWKPGRSSPLIIDYLVVNGATVALDLRDNESPFSRSTRGTGPDGEIRVGWKVSPAVPLQGLVIAIVNRTSGRERIVGTSGALQRGEQWVGMEKVVPP